MRYIAIAVLLIALCSTLGADFVNGTTTWPASGNKQVSTTSYNLYQLTVFMPAANTGGIATGGASVTTSNAPLLTAGYSQNWNKPSAGINPASLYFACTVSGDSINWSGSR